MQKTRNFVIVFLILISITALGSILFITQRFIPNDPYEIGNTAGNLNNKGRFCEQSGVVFFSNAYDNNVLYSMTPNETNIQKLGEVGVASLNADSERIYYSQIGSADGSGLGYVRGTNGMYRCNHRGQDTYCYTRNPVGILSLVGNNIYFQHYEVETGAYLDVTPIEKKSTNPLLYSMVSPAGVNGNIIYYAGNDSDHYLYALDTTTNTSTLVWEKQVWNPVYQDGYVYFMDLRSNYELHRYNLSSGEEEILSTDRLDYFNVYGNIIYYQKSSTTSPALKRINIDGTGEEIVKEGTFESVNITSQYAYFNEFNKPVPVYHQSTYGPIAPSVWMPVAGQ